MKAVPIALNHLCKHDSNLRLEFISKEAYAVLYKKLMEHLGTNREKGYLPEMGTTNVMYGQYMRIDLLMRDGKQEQVLKECRKLLFPMVKRTGTCGSITISVQDEITDLLHIRSSR